MHAEFGKLYHTNHKLPHDQCYHMFLTTEMHKYSKINMNLTQQRWYRQSKFWHLGHGLIHLIGVLKSVKSADFFDTVILSLLYRTASKLQLWG